MFIWILSRDNSYLRSNSSLSVFSLHKNEGDLFKIRQVQHSPRNTSKQLSGISEDNCWSVCCWNHSRIVGNGMWNLYHDSAVVIPYCLNFSQCHLRLSSPIHWLCIFAWVLHQRRSEAIRKSMDARCLSGYWRNCNYFPLSDCRKIKSAIRE